MAPRLIRLVIVTALLLAALVGWSPSASAATPITVSGTVTDQHGDPVPGAKVEAWGRYDRYDSEFFARTRADATGHYSFTFDPKTRANGFPVWAGHLRIFKDGYWDTGHDLPDYEPGDSLTVDPTMDKKGTLSGTVVDPDGQPVIGATVRLHNVETEYGYCDDDNGCLPGGWIDDVLTTDADGFFSRWAHPRDLIGVVVSAPGFEPQVVYDAEVEDVLRIQLSPGAGEFAPTVVQGVLRDSAGAPLADHKVFLGDYAHSRDDSEIVTDADGHYAFRFDPLEESYWTRMLYVQAWAPALHEHSRAAVPASPSGYYEPGATYVVDLPLDAAGTVTGLVTDEAGAPLPGVVVTDATTDQPEVVATTDDAGRYEFVTYSGSFGIDFSLDGYYDQAFGYSGTVTPGATHEVPAKVLMAYSAPSAVTDVRATARSPRRAKVRGDYPADHGGAYLDRFAARCLGPDVATRSKRGTSPTLVVKRLRPARRYHCQMRAHNAYGWSPWSEFSDWFRTPRPLS